MNHLLIGLEDKTQHILDCAEPGALLIDDGGPLTEQFIERFRPRVFDPEKHSFNPLAQRTVRQMRDFAAILYDGKEHLMTYRDGRRALTQMLLQATKIDDLPLIKHVGYPEARATMNDLLLSPTLSRVLCGEPNFTFDITVVARLDRAKLGDFDAFVLAGLLAGQANGQVIIPDFGFYGRDLHRALIRQNRLIAGVNRLAELPALQHILLTIKDKVPAGCVFEDAELLAKYAKLKPGDVGYSDFVWRAMA
ncbi:hypothetical protein [Bradyrhizobium guangzhouense]|uniref:Uncharacterized protein n=1 Tax=Bradyrhizobium guangzhouense TaxID=1325095 RepID=A0AAE6CBD4_9BRAD|nr:hypothetical protein [Bradyrhizobium guangzhouense]QAU49661.1 hypothetical protein XH91_32720 [Bradyrhizobium guangzhouense]